MNNYTFKYTLQNAQQCAKIYAAKKCEVNYDL